MACFAYTNVSQGIVATYARCGGIFNIRLTANLQRNLPVKKFPKSIKIWRNYGHESVAPLHDNQFSLLLLVKQQTWLQQIHNLAIRPAVDV